MNIVITTETYLPFIAGVSSSSDNIARFMARSGHTTTLIAPNPTKDGHVNDEKNLTIVRTPSFPDPFFAGKSFSPIPLPLWKIFSIIRKGSCDIVHIQEPGALGVPALLRAKALKIPVIGALHFTPEQIFRILSFPENSRSKQIILLFMKFFYNACDGIMIPTQTFSTMLKNIGVTKPIVVVSNGVDTNEFTPTKNRIEKREAYGLPNDKILFFFLGRLDFDKHADTIIKTLPYTNDTIHLVIAGVGKEENNFRALAKKIGVQDRITWLGHLDQTQMKDVYQSVDTFVLMSPYEVQSIVTLQAISAALPILACKEGALPELCHDGINGFTIATDDHTALAEKMNILSLDENLRNTFGQESRKISLPHDRNVALSHLEQFYKKIIASRKK